VRPSKPQERKLGWPQSGRYVQSKRSIPVNLAPAKRFVQERSYHRDRRSSVTGVQQLGFAALATLASKALVDAQLDGCRGDGADPKEPEHQQAKSAQSRPQQQGAQQRNAQPNIGASGLT